MKPPANGHRPHLDNPELPSNIAVSRDSLAECDHARREMMELSCAPFLSQVGKESSRARTFAQELTKGHDFLSITGGAAR